MSDTKTKFIRVRGKIVPIRSKGSDADKMRAQNYKAQAKIGAGVGIASGFASRALVNGVNPKTRKLMFSKTGAVVLGAAAAASLYGSGSSIVQAYKVGKKDKSLWSGIRHSFALDFVRSGSAFLGGAVGGMLGTSALKGAANLRHSVRMAQSAPKGPIVMGGKFSGLKSKIKSFVHNFTTTDAVIVPRKLGYGK